MVTKSAAQSTPWPHVSGDRDWIPYVLRLVRQQRPLSPFISRGKLLFATDDPDICAEVLKSKSDVYEGFVHPYRDIADLYDPAGRALLRLDPDTGTAREAVRAIHGILETETARTIEELITRCRTPKPIELMPALRELVLRSMTRILWDVDSSLWSRDFAEAAAFVEIWQILVGGFRNHPALRHFMSARETMDRAADKIVRLARSRSADSGADQNDEPAKLRASVGEMIMNAYNAPAILLGWIFVELSRRPDIYGLVQREADEARLDDHAVAELPYTRQVVMECLRHHPPAWAVGRWALRENTLSCRMIPKDARVVCSIYGLHHHPAFWPHADEFDPERFGRGRAPTGARAAFLPFGLGPKACPVGYIVPTMLQTILATIMKTCEFRLDRTACVGNRTLVALAPYPDPGVWFSARSQSQELGAL